MRPHLLSSVASSLSASEVMNYGQPHSERRMSHPEIWAREEEGVLQYRHGRLGLISNGDKETVRISCVTNQNESPIQTLQVCGGVVVFDKNSVIDPGLCMLPANITQHRWLRAKTLPTKNNRDAFCMQVFCVTCPKSYFPFRTPKARNTQ